MELSKVTKTFFEERDCCGKSTLPDFNEIKVTTVDNGTGKYLVISTKRWALDEDSLEDFIKELRNMLKEANKGTLPGAGDFTVWG